MEEEFNKDIYTKSFVLLMGELNQIGKQISTIRNKVEELKKDRLFTKPCNYTRPNVSNWYTNK